MTSTRSPMKVKATNTPANILTENCKYGPPRMRMSVEQFAVISDVLGKTTPELLAAKEAMRPPTAKVRVNYSVTEKVM